MKKFARPMIGIVMSATLSLPAIAQQSATRLPDETAIEMATRIRVCDDRNIESARFDETESALQVRCEDDDGMAGGLGAGGVAVGALALVAIVAAASGGGGGSSTPSTN